MKQPDVQTALRIYLQYPRIGSSEIRELFGPIGNATVAKLKAQARLVMSERDVARYDAHMVDTECAYIAWGLDPADLEKRYARLRKFNFLSAQPVPSEV